MTLTACVFSTTRLGLRSMSNTACWVASIHIRHADARYPVSGQRKKKAQQMLANKARKETATNNAVSCHPGVALSKDRPNTKEDRKTSIASTKSRNIGMSMSTLTPNRSSFRPLLISLRGFAVIKGVDMQTTVSTIRAVSAGRMAIWAIFPPWLCATIAIGTPGYSRDNSWSRRSRSSQLLVLLGGC